MTRKWFPLIMNGVLENCLVCAQFSSKLAHSTVDSTVSGHRQFRVNLVFRYFNYPVIFSDLLTAWKVMLAVETWLIEVLITTCLIAPIHGKVKVPANYLYVTAKTSVWSSSSGTTVPGQPLGFPQKYGSLGKTIVIEHHYIYNICL